MPTHPPFEGFDFLKGRSRYRYIGDIVILEVNQRGAVDMINVACAPVAKTETAAAIPAPEKIFRREGRTKSLIDNMRRPLRVSRDSNSAEKQREPLPVW